MKLVFFVPGVRGKGRPRFYGGHAVTDSKTRAYETLIKRQAINAIKEFNKNSVFEILNKPCAVKLRAFFLVPKSYSKVKRQCALSGFIRPGKPDADNIVKSILDGMNKVVFEDDKSVYQVSIEKMFSDTLEGVEVVVEWNDDAD